MGAGGEMNEGVAEAATLEVRGSFRRLHIEACFYIETKREVGVGMGLSDWQLQYITARVLPRLLCKPSMLLAVSLYSVI